MKSMLLGFVTLVSLTLSTSAVAESSDAGKEVAAKILEYLESKDYFYNQDYMGVQFPYASKSASGADDVLTWIESNLVSHPSACLPKDSSGV